MKKNNIIKNLEYFAKEIRKIINGLSPHTVNKYIFETSKNLYENALFLESLP